MNSALLFKISITAIVIYGNAATDDNDMTALENTIKQYLESDTFQEILANEITHIDDVRETEIEKEEREGAKIYSMKEEPDGLLVKRRIWSPKHMQLLKEKKKKQQDYFELKNKENQRKANRKRINELVEFMQNNVQSTNYFHSEVQRIKKNRQVIDDVRNMVNIADTTLNNTYAKAIIACYDIVLSDKVVDIFAEKVNNLVINVPNLRDV